MTTILIIFAGFALWHYCYESFFAPTARMALRHRVFAYRDRLRTLMIDEPHVADDEIFSYMQDSLNNAILYLHEFHPSDAVAVDRAIRNDVLLRTQVERRLAALDECESTEIQEIRQGLRDTMRSAMAANAGGWLVWLLPVLLCFAVHRHISTVLTEFLTIPRDWTEDLIGSTGRPAMG